MTNFLLSVFYAKRYPSPMGWKEAVKTMFKYQHTFPHGTWQQGNRANRRMGISVPCTRSKPWLDGD
jgi:hypothetical protein